jgi:hypothetical protein
MSGLDIAYLVIAISGIGLIGFGIYACVISFGAVKHPNKEGRQ